MKRPSGLRMFTLDTSLLSMSLSTVSARSMMIETAEHMIQYGTVAVMAKHEYVERSGPPSTKSKPITADPTTWTNA